MYLSTSFLINVLMHCIVYHMLLFYIYKHTENAALQALEEWYISSNLIHITKLMCQLVSLLVGTLAILLMAVA